MLKILMFGWEYPPEFTGGLGVACQGLVNGFSNTHKVDLTFVLPKKISLLDSKANFVFADQYSDKHFSIKFLK
jgi:hypothetical protein